MAASAFIRAPWASPAGVSSLLVEPPAVEPLTLDEGKARAGLDWPSGDPRDALMTGWIKAARQKVEADTGLALIEQTRLVTIGPSAAWGGWVGGEPLPLPSQTIPTVSIAGVDGAIPPELVDGLIPPEYTGTFTVVAGWPNAAALAAEAPLLVQAVGLLVAHFATFGRDVATIEEPFLIPLGYDDCVSSYRLLRIV